MICSTQMNAFDVPRGLRVKLHVPLGYWIKLRAPWSQSAKYTWWLYCHRKQHTIRDFVFYFKQTLFPYSAHRKVVQRNVAEMFFGTFSISGRHCMKYVSRTPWGRGACTSRLGSRRSSWMMQSHLQFSVSSLLITRSDGVELSTSPAQSGRDTG